MLGKWQSLSNLSMSVQHCTSGETNEQLVHEFPVVYWIKTLITLLATFSVMLLSCASSIQASTPYSTFYSRFLYRYSFFHTYSFKRFVPFIFSHQKPALLTLAFHMPLFNLITLLSENYEIWASPSGRAVYGISLQLLDCWDSGFESHLGHGCLCCEWCVLSGRVLCDEPFTRPEESFRLRWVAVFDLEISRMRRPWPSGDCCARNKQYRDN